MKKNPFQCKKQKENTLEGAIHEAISGVKPEPEKQIAEPLIKTIEPVQINEAEILKTLIDQKAKEKQGRIILSNYIYNHIKLLTDEKTKTDFETTMGSLLYYQTPETHTIKKENSTAYASIFVNWREGLAGLFAEYRKANTKKTEFSFYAYSDGIVHYFHTNECGGCVRPCCANKSGYSLFIISDSQNPKEIYESEFIQNGSEWYLSGRGVLFILDTLLNTQASSVCALPLVISKYPFLNGILKKPSFSIRSENRSGEKMYRIAIKGWIITSDILFVNSSHWYEMKHVEQTK
ncbi:hypothetical protein NEIG_00304 [Nematocida sp. ERTm5]|nr:hypothetical protein NEIG_00304 [Nematocida sp. ERTm5]